MNRSTNHKISPPSCPTLVVLPTLPLSASFLRSAQYAHTGAGKVQWTARRKKTEAASVFSVFSFKHTFPLHHYEGTGNPAHKSRAWMCGRTHTHLRRSNSRRLFRITQRAIIPGGLLSLLLKSQTRTQVLVWCVLTAGGGEPACTLSRSFTCQT